VCQERFRPHCHGVSKQNAHHGSKPACVDSQTVSELLAAEDEVLSATLSTYSESQASGPEDPAPTSSDSDEENVSEEINLMSCLEVHYEKQEGVHGVLVCDSKIEISSSVDKLHHLEHKLLDTSALVR